MLPILLLVFLLFLATRLMMLAQPYFSARETETVTMGWEASQLLNSLKEVTRQTTLTANDVQKQTDIFQQALDHAGNGIDNFWFSPKQLKALKATMRLKAARLERAQRQLIYSYSCSLSKETLIASFVRAFVANPAIALVSGVELAEAAKVEAKRLRSSDNILADDVEALYTRQELLVAGCIRTLSGRDDIVDELFSSKIGGKVLRLAISCNLVKVVALPEVQRYLDSMWSGHIVFMREDRLALQNLEAEQARLARTGGGGGSKWAALRQTVKTGRLLKDSAANSMRLSIAKSSLLQHQPVVFRAARYFLSTWWLIMPVRVMVCPIVAMWPPLELLSDDTATLENRTLTKPHIMVLQQIFYFPPELRFYMCTHARACRSLAHVYPRPRAFTRARPPPFLQRREHETHALRATRVHARATRVHACVCRRDLQRRVRLADDAVRAAHCARSSRASSRLAPSHLRLLAIRQVLRVRVGEWRVRLPGRPRELGRHDLRRVHVRRGRAERLHAAELRVPRHDARRRRHAGLCASIARVW